MCKICGEKFDREKKPYVQVSASRYAHAECALRAKEAGTLNLDEIKVIDPTDIVTCIYCKKTFNKQNEEYKLFSNGKYAHKSCAELEEKRELTDQEKLEKYIMDLFQTDYVYARIQRQIKTYVTDYGYTYSGIHKALIYYYEIKNHPFDAGKAQGGIGIVPYVYEQAYAYYYAIWEAQQKQEYIVDASSLEAYVPKVIEIKIPVPIRKPKEKRKFAFLEEEE